MSYLSVDVSIQCDQCHECFSGTIDMCYNVDELKEQVEKLYDIAEKEGYEFDRENLNNKVICEECRIQPKLFNKMGIK